MACRGFPIKKLDPCDIGGQVKEVTTNDDIPGITQGKENPDFRHDPQPKWQIDQLGWIFIDDEGFPHGRPAMQ